GITGAAVRRSYEALRKERPSTFGGGAWEEVLSGMDGNHGDVESRYRQELARERATRERLERQLNEIATENRRRREETEEAERVSVIREGLEERGVKKTRLALRLVKDDVKRGD